MFHGALCREAWDEMLVWASEKIARVFVDEQADLKTKIDILNGEAGPKGLAPSQSHISYVIMSCEHQIS